MSVTVDGINYTLSGSNATVTGGTSRAITTLTIPSTITYLGTTYNVTKIGNNAFKDYLNLTSITIPNSVTSIEYEAFQYCTNLQSITIGSGVTSIGSDVFYACTSLTNIVVDSENTTYSSLNNVIFNKAQTILILYPIGLSSTSYTIPSSVTSIDGGAFKYCSKLTSVTIPNGLLTIGGSAFFGCGLTSIFIPSTVTSIGGDNYTFYGCPLTSIVVDPANTAYSSLDNVLFNKAQTILIQYAAGLSSSTYTIPDGVISIASLAFSNCFSLASVTFMGDIPTIGTNNFTANTNDTAYYYTGAQNISRLSPTQPIFANVVALAGAQPAPVITSVTTSTESATINFTQETTEGLNPITSYRYSIDAGLKWVSAGTTTSPIVLTGLTNGTPYNFALRNFNGLNSGVSNIVQTAVKTTVIKTFIGTGDFNAGILGVGSATEVNIIGYNKVGGFQYNSQIKSISMSNSVGQLGYGAFMYTPNLETIRLSNNANSFNRDIFLGSGLKYVFIDSPNTAGFPSPANDVSFPGQTGNRLSYTFLRPSGVSTIRNNVYFVGETGQTLTQSVVNAGIGSATAVATFGYSYIGANAFSGNSQIKSLNIISNSVKSIDPSAFQNSGLSRVIISSTNDLGISSPATGVSFFGATVQTFTVIPQPDPVITSVTTFNQTATIGFTQDIISGTNAITGYEYSIDGGANWVSAGTVTASPITITGLTNGTTYNFVLRNFNTSYSSNSNTVASARVPSAPTITHATVSLTGIIYISFTSGADNGAAITNYQYSADNGTTWVTREPVSITSPLLITGLPKRISYAIQIRAGNAVGYGAAVTAASQFIPDVPSAPTINSVTVSSGQASIAFTPGANNGPAITNYEYSINNGTSWVTRNPVSITSPLVITGLTNGTPYTFLVRAINAAGNGDIATSSSTLVDVVPGAPTITGVNVSSGQAVVAFTPGTNIGSAIKGYEYSKDNGLNWVPVGTSSPITVPNLTNGTRYTFLVRAINAIGAGASVSSVSTLVDVAPGAPTINSVNVSSGQAVVAFTPGTNIGSAIKGYEYSKDNGSTWVSVGTSSPITVTTGLTNGTSYDFKVRAVNAMGAGAVSNLLNKMVRPTLPEAKALNTLKATYALFYGYQLQELVNSGLYTLPELKQIGYVLGELKAHFTTETLITSWLFPGSELKQEGLIQSGIDFFIIVIVFNGVFSIRRTYALNNTNKEVTRYNVWFEGVYSQNQLTSESI